jgi:MFS family permease
VKGFNKSIVRVSIRFASPNLVLLFGALVYFTLFESFGRDRELITERLKSERWLLPLCLMGKIVVFSITIFLAGRKSRNTWKKNLIWGASLACIGSFLLIFSSSNFKDSLAYIFIVETISAIGEGLVAAGIVTYIRMYFDNSYAYSKYTVYLRIGQNIGMTAAIFVGSELQEDFSLYYNISLFACAACILILSIYIRKLTRDLPPVPPSHTKKKTPLSLRLVHNVIVGICASGTFYLVVFGPIALYQKSYSYEIVLEINGIFSIIALVFIMAIFNRARNRKDFSSSFQGLERWSNRSLAANIAFWIISLFMQKIYWLCVFGALLGLFSTSSYVLNELNSGMIGRKETQIQQVLRYLGITKLGPVTSLLLISISGFLLKENPASSRDVIIIFAVVAGIAIWQIIKPVPKDPKTTVV